MSKLVFLSPEGFRMDGRLPSECRHCHCRLGDLSATADGSAQVDMGCTKVIAYVFGPSESNKYQSNPDRAEVHCDLTFAPFSRPTRMARRVADRASVAKALSLRQILESTILLDKYPKAHVTVSIAILEDDGGSFPAAINAATLALIDAGIPLKDFVASCAVGWIGNEVVIDLNESESNVVGAELTLAVHRRTEEMIWLELDSRISSKVFEKMKTDGIKACQGIATTMKNAIEERFRHLANNK